MYDRRPLDRVSSFLSELVSYLLSTDPKKRPSAKELLRRIHHEQQKVKGRPEPQTQKRTREEDDDENDDEDDSDYETLVRSNASKSKFNLAFIFHFPDILQFILIVH